MTTQPPPSPASRAMQPLPHHQPAHSPARVLLFVIRRMGAHGLHDAMAAQALFTTFGPNFRRPLTLIRTLMAEVSSVSVDAIRIAPACCCRMTADEGALVECIVHSIRRPGRAALIATDLLGRREPGSVLIAAAAVAGAFEDLGAPLCRG